MAKCKSKSLIDWWFCPASASKLMILGLLPNVLKRLTGIFTVYTSLIFNSKSHLVAVHVSVKFLLWMCLWLCVSRAHSAKKNINMWQLLKEVRKKRMWGKTQWLERVFSYQKKFLHPMQQVHLSRSNPILLKHWLIH